MNTRIELARALLSTAHDTLTNNVARMTVDEALDPAGGYRSALGILKHTAAWSHVYHSYAFDASPKHWQSIDWPRGARDTIDPTAAYVEEIVAWFETSFEHWTASLAVLDDPALDVPHRCHWGATAPLIDIVLMVADHWSFHAGEVNALLSIRRGEAWEYLEEVEENNISTAGHRMRPGWMNAAQIAAAEKHLAARDAELRGGEKP